MFVKSSLKMLKITDKCDCCGEKIKQGFILQFGINEIVLCKKCNNGVKEIYKYKNDMQHCMLNDGRVY